MIRSDEELEVLRSRVAMAQSECDAALAARHRTQEAFQSALDAINRATQEGNTSGDLSEARRLRIALQASDLRERRFEATSAAQRSCEHLKAAQEDLIAALRDRQTNPSSTGGAQ